MSGANQGASGNKKIFIVGDRTYTTTAFPAGQIITEKEALALIRNGQATLQVPNYQDQYPWTKPATK